MQKVIVIGNLGKDCVLKKIGDKTAINFSVAHTEKFKNKEGVTEENTTWWDCGIWKRDGQSTELAKYLNQGKKVYIEGVPSFSTYKANDGTTKMACRINVLHLELLSPKGDNDKSESPTQSENNEVPANPAGANQDDLPF